MRHRLLGMSGKRLRLRRLLSPQHRAVVVPLDHGVSDGPLDGIQDPLVAIRAVVAGGADSIVVHKGLMRYLDAELLGGAGVWMHISASTVANPDWNDKRLVASVDEAARLGADGVSIHVNVGATSESRMVEDFGRISGACEAAGMPLLAMCYPRGPAVADPHDTRLVAHAARLADELGADVVKVPYTGQPDTFTQVTAGVKIPVLISGGPKTDSDDAFLTMVHGSLVGGGAGVSTGRNLWQHRDPAAITRAIAALIHDGVDVDAARKHLE